MQTLKSEICSSEDAVCLISELSLSMNKYESLVGYTNKKLIQYQEKTGVPIPSLFCGRKVVDSASQKMLLGFGGFDAPLCDPEEGFLGVSWDFTKWLGYIANKECLWSTVGTIFHLRFLIRGDDYPCGGGSWAHWSVALLKHGYLSHTLSHCWPIGVAGCDEKHLDALQFLWKRNIGCASFFRMNVSIETFCFDPSFFFRSKLLIRF